MPFLFVYTSSQKSLQGFIIEPINPMHKTKHKGQADCFQMG